MKIVEATYSIVTPMFIGGADQSPDDGIRPPSVKGALRFWWRALNWGRFRTEPGANDATALKKLHEEEARLFGLAANTVKNKQVGGQGCFLLTVRHEHIRPIQPPIRPFSGKAYLAGMGLNSRKALPGGQRFSISLRFRSGTGSADIQSLEEAIRVFGLVGGLGSRSRRGFGSVVKLVSVAEGWRLPTINEIEAEYDWLKKRLVSNGRSPFSAIDANSLFYSSINDFISYDDALEEVGKLMNLYRTNGTSSIPGRGAPPAGHRYVAGGTAPIANLKFFTTDHNQVHAIANLGAVTPPNNVPPKRSIFGLPHQYCFSSLNRKTVSFDYKPGGEKGRRASPLLVHILAFTDDTGQDKYRPLLLLLEADFLPANTLLSVSVNNASVSDVPSPTDYKPIKTFLSTKFTKVLP